MEYIGEKKIKSLMVLLALVLALPVSAIAAGKVVIKPTVTGTWRTDNNFFKAETSERDVSTYLLQPGVEVGYETGKSNILAGYTLDIYNYDDQDTIGPGLTPADTADYTGQTGTLNLETSPTERLTLGLDGSFMRSRDPANSDVFSNAVDRDKFDINRITPSISYNFGAKFTATARYRHTDTDYELVTMEDSAEKRPIFDIVYNLNRKTSLDLEYQRWVRNYDLLTSGYRSNQLKLIFRRQLNFFGLEAGGGYHKRSFVDPALNDLDVFTYQVGLVGQDPPAPEADPRVYLNLIAQQNFNDSGTGDSYFISTRAILSAGYVYRERLPLGVTVTYQISDYERTYGLTPAGTSELRDDDAITVEGSAGYIITEWLRFALKGGLQRRDSNIAGKDYNNRYMMATLNFSYNIGKR